MVLLTCLFHFSGKYVCLGTVALPDPKPGLVVRYGYLWADEAASGQDQGKTRPACLVATIDPAVLPRYAVLLPITYTPPADDSVGIEVPARVRNALGLDDARAG